MKCKSIVLIVQDLDKSKVFYHQIMGLHILYQYHGRVVLSSNIILQSVETWKDLIHKDEHDIHFEHYTSELYFEVDDLDEFLCYITQKGVCLVHPIQEQNYHRTVRFYDPDGHIIEVSESLKKIIKRFLNLGISKEEISHRLDIPTEYINHITKKETS